MRGSFLSNWAIGKRITVMTSLLILVTISLMTWFAVNQASRSLEKTIHSDLDHVAENMVQLCQLQEETLAQKLKSDLAFAQQTLAICGRMAENVDGRFRVDTTKQNKIGNYLLPSLLIGDHPLAGDTQVVDDVQTATSSTCTIFQVIPNHWVRISTNIVKGNGERATGTSIDSDSPVYQAVMKGKTYIGSNVIEDQMYDTAYKPMHDQDGNLVAVLYVGIPHAQFTTLQTALKTVKTGNTGYVFCVNSSGITMAHPKGVNKDLSEEPYIQKVLEKKAEMLKDKTWKWRDTYSEDGVEKYVAYRYFAPFDWVIAATGDVKELQAPIVTMRNVLLTAMVMFILIGVFVASKLSQTIVRPVHMLIARLKDIAQGEGDLSKRVEITTNDEIGELGKWFNLFVETVQKIVESIDKIASGNYDEEMELARSTEIGMVGQSMNTMLLDLRKRRAEAELLRNDVASMLKIASAASQGDFTVEARMSEGVVGILADSFNVMLEDLSTLIQQVRGSSEKVSTTTHELMLTNEQMSKGAEIQSQQILNTTSAIDEMSVSIQSVSENAEAAAQASQKTLSTATEGGKTVIEAIDAMKRIRDTVQRTAQQIKALGESSLEIGDIVKVINNIAGRTNLLALNATIEAAKAGEAGKGFAVVADEVRKLADQATKASNDIATLIQGIQSDMTVTINSMEKVTGEVEGGSKLATHAGNALEQIMQMAQESAELIQGISLAAKQQAKASTGIVESMSQISSISQETATSSLQATRASGMMLTISEHLSKSVETFKLKED